MFQHLLIVAKRLAVIPFENQKHFFGKELRKKREISHLHLTVAKKNEHKIKNPNSIAKHRKRSIMQLNLGFRAAIFFAKHRDNYEYIFSRKAFISSLSMYSSKEQRRSITPLGVISMIRLATVCANSWSCVLKRILPL